MRILDPNVTVTYPNSPANSNYDYSHAPKSYSIHCHSNSYSMLSHLSGHLYPTSTFFQCSAIVRTAIFMINSLNFYLSYFSNIGNLRWSFNDILRKENLRRPPHLSYLSNIGELAFIGLPSNFVFLRTTPVGYGPTISALSWWRVWSVIDLCIVIIDCICKFL